MIRQVSNFIFFFTLTIFILSCEDVLNSDPINKGPGEEAVMTFSSEHELLVYAQEQANIPDSKLQAVEGQAGFSSLARKSSSIYEVLSENIKANRISLDSVLSYANAFRQYISVERDSIGDYTILPKSIVDYRTYAFNGNGIAYVDGKLMKLLSDGSIIYTDPLHYDAFSSLKDLNEIPLTIPFEIKEEGSQELVQKTNPTELQTNGAPVFWSDCIPSDNQTIVRQKTSNNLRARAEFAYNLVNPTAIAVFTGYVTQKFGFFWLAASRTLNYGCYLKATRKAVGAPDQTAQWDITRTGEGPAQGFVHTRPLFSYTSGNSIQEDGLYFWFDIATVEPAIFSCNAERICSDLPCQDPFGSSPCDGVVCPSGSTCENGQCIDDIPVFSDCLQPCPVGWVCVQGECVECVSGACLEEIAP